MPDRVRAATDPQFQSRVIPQFRIGPSQPHLVERPCVQDFRAPPDAFHRKPQVLRLGKVVGIDQRVVQRVAEASLTEPRLCGRLNQPPR